MLGYLLPNACRIAIKVDDPAHWLGRSCMMLVLYISALALLSLASFPDLSL